MPNPWKQSWRQGRTRNKREKYEKKAQEKKKFKKFSWLFCAKVYLRKSDKCNRYMCLVFILQPMCLLRCCIINRMKSWILIVDSSLIVKSLVHGYTLMHACYIIDGFIFFLLQHMTWYAICMLSSWTLMNIIPILDEIIVKRGRSNVKIFGFLEKQGEFLESCWEEHVFGSIGNFFLLKRGRSFLLDFWARCVHLYEVCFLPSNIKTFLWVCQCVHQGGDCKIKGVFDYYSVMNN